MGAEAPHHPQVHSQLLPLPQLAGSGPGAVWPFTGSQLPDLPDAATDPMPRSHTPGTPAAPLASQASLRPPVALLPPASSQATASQLARAQSALCNQRQPAADRGAPQRVGRQPSAPPLMWVLQVQTAQEVASGMNLEGLLTATALTSAKTVSRRTQEWLQQLPVVPEPQGCGPLLSCPASALCRHSGSLTCIEVPSWPAPCSAA